MRKPSAVVTFPTTAAAMACEELCERDGLPGRMIPVPGEVSAGCGLAWKLPVGCEGDFASALDAAGVPFEAMTVVELLEFER